MGHELYHNHTHDHSAPHGHVHENQKAVVNRLARAIGHLEKVKRMVEEGHDCSEVLVQLAAVRSAIDNTGKVILQDHMRHCMVEAVAAGERDIQVPRPYARTKYSAMEGLAYLNTEDITDWPNVYMAKYFGADSMTGY